MSFDIKLIDDFEDTQIKFGDYIRLKGLAVGDLISLENNGAKTVIFVGNATPYMSVSTNDGGIGWYWKEYNSFRLLKVQRLYMSSEDGRLFEMEDIITIVTKSNKEEKIAKELRQISGRLDVFNSVAM